MPLTVDDFKEQFHRGNITYDDLCSCAINWHIEPFPRSRSFFDLEYKVLKYVGLL